MSDKYCVNCAYFVRSLTEKSKGWCHRYPPTSVSRHLGSSSYIDASQPSVIDMNWCGEWKDRVKIS